MKCSVGVVVPSFSGFPRRLLALAFTASVFAFAQPAAACSLVSFRDNGQYVGGDLTAQIAAKADTIQIVTVKTRRLVHRTFTQGEWYLQFGDTDVPEGRPEYTDVFAFELEPVETLKVGGSPVDFLYEKELRIAGYDPGVFGSTPQGESSVPASHPNSLPVWLLERPGDGGYAFIGAAEGSGLGGGECAEPYFLEVGQTLVALRDSLGRLYPADGAFPLPIEAEFRLPNGRANKVTLNMQSLIPINGPDDPFLGRLRLALAASRP